MKKQASALARECPECGRTDGLADACGTCGRTEMSEEHEHCKEHPCHECRADMVDAAEARLEGER